MTLALSPAFRRTLALTILALLLLLGASAVAWVADEYSAAQGTAQELQAAIERRQQAEAKLAELQAALAALKQHQASTVGFLQSSTESLAAAELQSRIKSAVEGAHGELRSTQILPGREEGGFHRVSIRGQIVVDMAAMQRMFYELEASAPFLFLDNVEIRARATSRQRVQGENPQLDVRFDLSGYLRRATGA
jgi:general secretion pathway protein M